MLCILQTLFHLSFPEKSDFTEEKREAHTVLVNPHRVNIPGQFCLISNPLSFQLFEAVSCEKKKMVILGINDLEECWVLLLNQASKLIDKVKISAGGLSATAVDVRCILREALLKRESAIAL